MAKFLGTQHYEFTCDIKKAQQIIEEIPDIMDEPFGDSSIIPVYLLAKETKANVNINLCYYLDLNADQKYMPY